MKSVLLVLIISVLCTFSAYAENSNILIGQDHPLSNKIWDVTAKRFVTRSEVEEALIQANYIFLGESHDNPRHHELQNWALITLLSADKKPGVAFEMIDDFQMKKINFNEINDADALFDTIGWEQSGWPSRELYRHIFQTVIEFKLPVYSANLNRETLRKVISQAQGPSEEINQLLEQSPLSPMESESMLKELEDSHCNMLPEQHVAGMMLGQRVKDAVMALSLLNHAATSPAVLVSGKGHSRLDRGAPSFIRQHKPGAKILSIGWHEVQTEQINPSDYAEIWHSESLPFSYAWFTPRVDRPDPCNEIKRFLEKKADNNRVL
jgi:uncharacterized iron-regulated protein